MKYILTCLLLIIVPSLTAAEDCSLLLASSLQGSEQADTNQKFFAYLDGLVNEGGTGVRRAGSILQESE